MLQANKIHSLDFKQKFLYSVVVDQLNKSKRETMKDLCIEGEIVKHLSVPDWNVIYQIVVIMITMQLDKRLRVPHEKLCG